MTQIPNGSADTDRAAIRDSELTVIGRIRSASNATFLCEVQNTSGEGVHCVYKPVRENSRYGTSRTAPWPAVR